MYYLAVLLLEGDHIQKDTTVGWEWMERAAKLGHAPSQTRIAEKAIASSDSKSHELALRYYELAADQNWPIALASLGYVHMLGKHVPKDEEKGWDFIVRAALLKEPRASFTWGVSLLKGERGVTNRAVGVSSLRTSAEQGHAPGQNAYGYMFERGDAGRRDIVEAWMWYELAAAVSNKAAIVNMEALRKKITPEQIVLARKRA